MDETKDQAEGAEKPKRGFAGLSPARRAEISRQGGRAAQVQGRGHRFTAAEAQEAGRIGGKKISEDREHMRQIGRAGAKARAKKKAGT